ncbi:MAG: serine hydrolase [Kordiimonadales bacterium]|nr:MAG: serine hydrolase [Kordiimonadales bacterium]
MVFNILAGALLTVTAHMADAPTPVDTKAITAALETRIEYGSGVGYFVGVINGDQQQILTAGLARKTGGLPLSENSLFEIGSITKTFTGILLADMILKGEVTLDDPVTSLLPAGTVLPIRNGQNITLGHLVTHSSGLPRLPSNLVPADISNPYVDYSVADMYEFLSGYTLPRDIGETVEYSNLGMGLLGHVLALKTEQSYEELVTERIFKPLGMSDSSITISEKQRPNFTDGHDASGDATSHWDLPTLAGAGAIRSSGRDMMKYLAANMGLTSSALSPAIEMSHKFQRDFGQNNMHIGFAWITVTNDAGDMTWHNGGTGGYRSFLGMNKTTKTGVLVLANSSDNADAIAHGILNGTVTSLVVTEQKEIALSAEVLAKYIGEYQLAPTFSITITFEDDILWGQATGQDRFRLFAKGSNEFFLKAVEASVTFVEGEAGDIVSMVFHQGGADLPGQKLEPKNPT